MTRIKGLLLLFGLLILSTNNLSASHYLGGEITWECVGAGQYKFTVVIYKECGVPSANYVSNQLVTPQGTHSLNYVDTVEVSPVCLGGGSIQCDVSPSGSGAVLKFTMEKVITLTGTPPAAGWTFYWNDSARPTNSLVNTNSGSYFLRAKMYPFTPVGQTTPLNANPCYDNSPYFGEVGSLTICSGAPFTYNHLASDKDADSLFVRFADPLNTGLTNPIVWASGYSTTSPYPSNITNAANGPITLNGSTGEVSMDIQVAPSGSYASCYAIESWRCGETPNGPGPVLIAQVFRDVAIVVQNNCPTNDEPVVLIDTAQYPVLNQLGPKVFEANVYPGDTVAFEMSASDFNYHTVNGVLVPQEIIFQAEGLQASNPYASGTGCNGVAPCATFTPVFPQTSYNKALNNRIRYFWVPDCQHLSVAGNFCNPFATFYFSLRMQDNGCPAPRVALTTLIVNVQIGDPSPIVFSCIQNLGNDQAKLGWHRSGQDSALEFNYYMILGNNVNGQVDTLDRIYNIDSLSLIVNNASNYTGFYIIKSTGKCDFLSEPSDTLELMNMTLTATPPGNAEIADLTWNAPSNPLSWTTDGVYEIWTEAPAGSGNWVMVGSTTNLNYTDQVTVCSAMANYQIRLYDTITGCYSSSNIDSAFFSDQTNKDQMVLDSASVNVNGNAVISWLPTAYGDVVEYYLYFNDPKTGWIVVDTIPAGTPMPWEWTGSNADQRPEEFRVISVDSCGNQSDDQIVVAHKTIYLRGYIDKCEAFARVGWNPYQGWGKTGVGAYVLQVQTTVGGVTSGWQTLFVGGSEDTSFTQYNLKNQTEYCYRIRAIDTSGTRTSTSNTICRLAQVPIKSRILYLAQVTNDANRGSLELNFLVDGQADVESFAIERAPHYLGPYETIGTVGKPTAPPYLVNFSDYGADPVKYHYYYRIAATDSCGGRDTLSNHGRNIILKVQERENLTNFLHWNRYETWGGGVKAYNIYRQGGDEARFTNVGQVQGNDTTFVDNIKDYANTKGNFCYYVEAVEGPNPLGIMDENGNPYTSRSNEFCMNQTAKVFMPTGFRPGSDIAANQTYGPSMRFTDVEQYNFYIMNRWGVKVFETNDPEERWDGTTDGNDAAQGVYIYYIKYATPGDSPVEQRGSFTLIR